MTDDPLSPQDSHAIEHDHRHTFRDTLKSTAMIGAATLVTVATGMLRAKAMALILGPAGVGLMGAFMLIADLTRNVAQLGINTSGVKQIAESAAAHDLARTSCTATLLRRVAVVTAIVGTMGLIWLAPSVSRWTFGNEDHVRDVSLLAGVVFFGVIAGGQMALIQGLRRIADLSKITVVGSLLGTGASIALIYILREEGIALSLVAASALSALTGWWFRRRVVLPPPVLSWSGAVSETTLLLRLGLAFLASGLLVLGSSYLVRILVLRYDGLEAAGLYQSAWTIGGLYIGFILQAMGADFYPRIVGVITKPQLCNRLVNEQTQISLLMAGPGVMATLTLAPPLVLMLYSAEFSGAVEMLRWICLGMALRIVSWPIGTVIVASNRQTLFFVTELAWALVHVAMSWLLVSRWGAIGASMGFFISYVFHVLMIYPAVRQLTGFRWTRVNLKLGSMYLGSIALVFVALQVLTPPWAMAFGTCATVLSGGYSFLTLKRMLASESTDASIPRSLKRLFRRSDTNHVTES
jgi:enterobacterial common antigen flippase